MGSFTRYEVGVDDRLLVVADKVSLSPLVVLVVTLLLLPLSQTTDELADDDAEVDPPSLRLAEGVASWQSAEAAMIC